MSEYRYDPYYGTWVAIATIRGERPHDFQQSESRVADARCPFCRGAEHETPTAVLELAAVDAPASLVNGEDDGWIVRVVPNKFPAITGEDDGWIGQVLQLQIPASAPDPTKPRDRGTLDTPKFPYAKKVIGGCQEILIESPRHVASLSELTRLERLLTLRALQERIRVGQADPTIQQISVFKNCRPEAGASLEHAHSQLIFSRFASAAIQQRWANCQVFWDKHRVSLIQSIRNWELEDLSRVVTGGDGYSAFCPYASRFPFQVWIVPDAGIGPFEQVGLDELEGLSENLRDAIARLESVHPQAPYNVLLHLPPPRFDADMTASAHRWFVEIIPRLGRLAGYELMGAGWVNEASPERAAAQLRAANTTKKALS